MSSTRVPFERERENESKKATTAEQENSMMKKRFIKMNQKIKFNKAKPAFIY